MIPVPHGSCKDCELNNPTSGHHRIEENQLLTRFQRVSWPFSDKPQWVLKPFWRGSELYLMIKPHGLSSHQPGQQLRMCCGWMAALWNLATSAPWHCFTTPLCPLRGPPLWLQAAKHRQNGDLHGEWCRISQGQCWFNGMSWDSRGLFTWRVIPRITSGSKS